MNLKHEYKLDKYVTNCLRLFIIIYDLTDPKFQKKSKKLTSNIFLRNFWKTLKMKIFWPKSFDIGPLMILDITANFGLSHEKCYF